MSFVNAVPGALGSASASLAVVGAEIGAANAVAATPTTGLMAAAHDQVSAAVAALFSSHARGYQAIGAQLATFHQQFVQALHAGASSYALTEAANASPMQQFLNLVNEPAPGSAGHPLIVDSTASAAPYAALGRSEAAGGAPGPVTRRGVGGSGPGGGRVTRPDGSRPAGDAQRMVGSPGVLLSRGTATGFGVGGTGRDCRTPRLRLPERAADRTDGICCDDAGTDRGGGSAGLLGESGFTVPHGFGDTEAGETGDVALVATPAARQASIDCSTGSTIAPWHPRQRWIAWRERERRDAVARPSRRRRSHRGANTLQSKTPGVIRAHSQPSSPALFRPAPATPPAPVRVRSPI